MIDQADRPDGGPSKRAVSGDPGRRWWLLAACFVTFTISAACMQSYTVFLVAFIEAFGWSRGESSIAYAVSQFVSGVTSPLVGVLVDRLGPRRLVLIGGAFLALGLVASSYINALWQVVLLYGIVMTLGANLLGLVAFVPMLSRHFVENRGMAVAIVQSANGFARGFSAPLSQWMISGLGWRWTYLAQGLFMAAAILPLSFLFRGTDPSPRDSDGRRDTRRVDALACPTHLSVLDAVPGLRVHWARELSCGPAPTRIRGHGRLRQAICRASLGNWRPFLVSRRDRDRLAVGSHRTRTFGGYHLRYLDLWGRCALLIRSPDQHLLFWLHACFFGLTWGARGPAITAKTADLFPGPQLGTILGAITMGTGVGSAGGSWLAGWSFDLTGSYHLAFWLSIFFYACGSVAFWLLRRPGGIRK